MKKEVFQIRDLWCAYQAHAPVLHIANLDIPRSCLVFIIGRSGIGKSTFIETLGLMNKTIQNSDTCTVLFNGLEEETVELKDHWSLPNKALSAFRKNHFSFIFQNTNLMPNFSAGENMAVSLLIKGQTLQMAKKEVLRVMQHLSLEEAIYDKKITEVSGGQRQRLAFVRAITADFDVLFGDEPTGNLDRNTAEELISVLKSDIKQKARTGIVVSHDLALAEKFADIIIPITPQKRLANEAPLGEIIPANILRKRNGNWTTASGKIPTSTVDYLNQFLID